MSEIQTTTTNELSQRLAQGNGLNFWNVLTDEYFKGEMIPQSKRVPLDRVGSEVSQSALAKDAEIVVYCASPACPASRQAAEKLVELGYTNVKAYEGGLEEWKKAGHEIVLTEKASA